MKSFRKQLYFSCLVAISSLWVNSCANSNSQPENSLQFVYVDPLVKVVAEASYFRDQEAICEVVRGENATLQFVVRSAFNIRKLKVDVAQANNSGALLPKAKTGFVGFVKVGRTFAEASRDRIVSSSGWYPDPILEQESIDVSFGNAQPIWVSIPVPKDAKPGIYKGRITVSGENGRSEFSLSKDYTIKVYPVTIDKTSLWVSNWFTADTAQLKWMNGGKPFGPYLEQYWGYMRQIAHKMVEYRLNAILASPLNFF